MNCHKVFEWKTKYACRHCLLHEVTNVIGPCTWEGKREITQTSIPECRIYADSYLQDIRNHSSLYSS
jgi:hypothetical protein